MTEPWQERRRAYLVRAGRTKQLAAEKRVETGEPQPSPKEFTIRGFMIDYAIERASSAQRDRERVEELQSVFRACRDALDRERFGVSE